MYGLVNLAFRELVLRDHGEQRWLEIVRRAAPAPAEFVGLQTYPDALTFRLFAAARDMLGIPLDDLLRQLGRHWVAAIVPTYFGEILDLMGRSLFDVLGNLNRLHDGLAAIMPDLRPPVFTSERGADGAMLLRYASHRSLLAPMVVGLIEGLATRFGEDVHVAHIPPRDPAQGPEHAFQITPLVPSAATTDGDPGP